MSQDQLEHRLYLTENSSAGRGDRGMRAYMFRKFCVALARIS